MSTAQPLQQHAPDVASLASDSNDIARRQNLLRVIANGCNGVHGVDDLRFYNDDQLLDTTLLRENLAANEVPDVELFETATACLALLERRLREAAR